MATKKKVPKQKVPQQKVKFIPAPPRKPSKDEVPAAKLKPAIDWDKIRKLPLRSIHSYPGNIVGHVDQETSTSIRFWAPCLIRPTKVALILAPIAGVQDHFKFYKASAFGEASVHPLIAEKYDAYFEEFIAGKFDLEEAPLVEGELPTMKDRKPPHLEAVPASSIVANTERHAEDTTSTEDKATTEAEDKEAEAGEDTCPPLDQGEDD